MSWVQRAARSVAVLTILLGYAGLYAFVRVRLVLVRSRDVRLRRIASLQGRVTRRAMERLGATFIKLGQVMSSRPDLFPPETIDELRHLQDSLPAFPMRDVRRVVAEDLGRPLEEIFDEFDEAPLAAASVAQVHRARLADGREVAVKVLRPSVRAQVKRDASLLLGFARVMRLHPTLKLSDPVGHMEHFVRGIQEQTDLGRELANYSRFRANFAERDTVDFPEVYAEHCSSRVLTMELIRGRKVDTLMDGDHGLDVIEIARRMRISFFQMCFEDGFVHADLHPGNMLVTEEGRVVVFDVGLAQAVEGDVLEQLIDFSRCVSFGTIDDFVRHLKRFHGYMENTDWDAITADATAFIERFRGQKQAELEWSQLLDQVFAIMRRHHLQPVPEVVLVMVGVVTAEGVGKMLEADLDTMGEMARFLVPILAKRGMLTAPNPAASG